MTTQSTASIDALIPRGSGHQLVVYGDACSGVAGAPHEANFAQVGRMLARLRPQPELVVFTGDEIVGLTADRHELEGQWRHFLRSEMTWPDRAEVPTYHVTGNHTAYDPMSEAVFRDVLGMPRNGPGGQEGLSYWVRRGDLLLVVVHTLWSGLGGEGHVETDWLREVLSANRDARYKLVAGHHPVFPVNGYSGAYQREIGPEHGPAFWDVLVEEGVQAYLCSYILAFDVQVQRGVLQITTAGAGTGHRMPEGVEYLHAVQMAIDMQGLRYQVLDIEGRPRERLSWPPRFTSGVWTDLPAGSMAAPVQGEPDAERIVAFRFAGTTAPDGMALAQTLLAMHDPCSSSLPPLWIGLSGPGQRLTVDLSPEHGRSPHTWHGRAFGPNVAFSLNLVVHAGMGPGGLLVRYDGEETYTSLTGASAWGAERLRWPELWSVAQGRNGSDDRPFLGAVLNVATMELAGD